MNQQRIAVFDAYGTLFDVHSAVMRNAAEVGAQAARLSALWRQKQLEYTWTRSLMGVHTDFEQVTREALDFAIAATATDTGLRPLLLDAYRKLDAYPDAAEALARYRAAGLRTVVFSNATSRMLDEGLQAAGLSTQVDAVVSVEPEAIYKPSPQVYAMVERKCGASGQAVVFHSSNAWDAAGAAVHGWRSLWINRSRQPREYAWTPETPEYADLAVACAAI